MSKWFYYNEQGEKIELTGGQLKGLAKTGMITPDTMVETEEGKTAPARKVKGLTFIAAVQSETSPSAESETYDSVSLPSASAEPNPFAAAPSVEASPFAVISAAAVNPFMAAPPVQANPIAFVPTVNQAAYQGVPMNISNSSSAATMVATMRSTMSFLASTLGLVLVIILACVVVGVIWWLLETMAVLPTHFLSRFTERQDEAVTLTIEQRMQEEVAKAYIEGHGKAAMIRYMQDNEAEDKNLVFHCVKYFVSQGIDVNAKYNGQTALYNAVTMQNVDAVKFLASKGADVNVKIATVGKGKNDVPLLHWAAATGNVEIVKVLVSEGANVKTKIEGGITALDLVQGMAKDERDKYKDVVKYLSSLK
jgi:hypothetical protein